MVGEFIKRFFYGLSFLFFVLGIGFVFSYFYIDYSDVDIGDISYSDGMFVISFDDFDNYTYCAVSNSLDDVRWEKVSDGVCNYKIDDFGKYNLYIKHYNKVSSYDVDRIFAVSFSKKVYYLSTGSDEVFSYDSLSIGTGNIDSFDVSNTSVVS